MERAPAPADAPGDGAAVVEPSKVPVTPVPATPAVRKEAAAPTSAKPVAVPPLDLTTLEKRLRETSAIGVFTKVALKNQVDDLLDQFRAHYQGRTKTTLAELRQAYDMLLLKVLSLLQDDDPTLARMIGVSREPIWGILADPVKFATL